MKYSEIKRVTQDAGYCIKADPSEVAGGTFATEESSPCIGAAPIVPDDIKQVQWASGGGKMENDTAQTLRSGAEYNYQFARINKQLRRLTPRECERLQGFPDDWTRVPYRKGEASDSNRYRALGNSMAVPVMRWIGTQIARVEEEGG